MKQNEYWYVQEGERCGPVTIEDLALLYRRRDIGGNTLVWFESEFDWQPLSRVEGLLVQLRTTPPPLPSEVPGLESRASPFSNMADSENGVRGEPRLFGEQGLAGPNKAAETPTTGGFVLNEENLARALAETTSASAWQRFAARTADGFICGAPLLVALALTSPSLFEEGSNLTLVLLWLPMAMLVESALIGLFGNSPGKALVGIRARPTNDSYLRFGSAFQRLTGVWTSGLFFGLPLVGNLLILYQGYRVLGGRPTTYDESRFFVSQGKTIWWRTLLVFLFALGANVFIAALAAALAQS